MPTNSPNPPPPPRHESPQWWLLWALIGFMAVLVLAAWGLLRLAMSGS